MSSTNKTSNYELSQYVGTDKPAWLTDYNQDMLKIDTGINTAQNTADGADGKADANTGHIGDLENLTTSTKSSLVAAINEVDGNADAAQGTASAAASTANTANITANNAIAEIAKFNLSVISQLTPSTNLGSISAGNTYVNLAKDSTGSIFKVYGRIYVNNLSGASGNLTVTLPNTGLNPEDDYNIEAAATVIYYNYSTIDAIGPRPISVNTNGDITINVGSISDITEISIQLFPCLYFNKSFGD